MTFHSSDFYGFIARDSENQRRLFSQYQGHRDDFDIIIIGSGIGGGILADELADRFGDAKRILLLEAGSYVFPTHVYNISNFDNAAISRKFSSSNFYQLGGFSDKHYIHEKPQMNFGGRSIFWSGLIPTIQPWELDFFPDNVKADLSPDELDRAGKKMNQSVSLGLVAQELVANLRASSLSDDFHIFETPRALHQPYLTDSGEPSGKYFHVATGVFNTSELIINQLGEDRDHNGNGLHLQIHQYVEDIKQVDGGWHQILSRTTTTGSPRYYYAPKVVVCGGSIESPKLLKRSSIGQMLSPDVRGLIGRGLTDHPTTDSRAAPITHCGSTAIPKDQHAKIIMYSRGDVANGEIKFPFNIEININHEYWHRHDIDPDTGMEVPSGASVIDYKFSFANCIDHENAVHGAAPYSYLPQVDFQNLNWTSHTVERINKLAGWDKSAEEVFSILNHVGDRVLAEFNFDGAPVSASSPLGENQRGFGRGTVHHAAGSLHLPYRPALGAEISSQSVIDENLNVRGLPGMYVCDMSVMPLSSAANPVRTLAALALRLSDHLF